MKKSEEENKVTIFNWQESLKNKIVIAFGLGKFYRDTWQRLDTLCKVSYLSDNNETYWGKTINNRKVISPEEIRVMKNNGLPIFVIIVAGIEGYLAIKIQLDAMDIPSMSISELHFHYYNKGKGFQWLHTDLPKIEKALNHLEDDTSRSIFKNMLAGLIYPKAGLPFKDLYSPGEYFKTGIWSVEENEILCDCGAYTGDTLMDFIDCSHGKFCKVHCFELDKGNFIQLKNNVKMLNQDIQKNIKLYNYGVYDKHTKAVCHYEGESDGCEITHSGKGEPCELVKLDDYIEECTILKMDIEGAEIAALEGATKLIQHCKPKLAICVYHRPEDIYEIPIKIKSLCNEYKIYLRHHSYNFLDTVLYAVV